MPEQGSKLKQLIAQEPDLTLAEMKARLELSCTVAAIHWMVTKLGLTYKVNSAKSSGRRVARAPYLLDMAKVKGP